MDFDSVISVADARTVLRLAVQLDIIDGKSDVPCTRFVKKDKR